MWKRDWIIVWTHTSTWRIVRDIKKRASKGNLIDDKFSFYTIKYSKSRNKFKLEAEGFTPKQHKGYGEALKVLSEYQTKKREI